MINYKNLYNLRNHQNINEIRDVINKYGENAKIHLGEKIEKLTWVDDVITVIDVPLLKSTDENLMDRLKNYKTLSYPIDKYFNQLNQRSGIVVYLKKDQNAEYIKIKDKYFNQLNEMGFKEYIRVLKNMIIIKIFII